MLRSFVVLFGILLGTASIQAEAATLTINGISGTWGNVATVSGPTGALTGSGTSNIKWGAPALGTTMQSGYNFKASGASSYTTTSSFLIGEYVHSNGIIWTASTQLASSRLNVSMSGTADGQAFSLSSLFGMIHNETQNNAPCPQGQQPCGDVVSIANLFGAPLTITTATSIFTLMIDGFVQQLGGPIVNSFYTPEGQSRSLFLQASLTIQAVNTPPPPPTVPLPAGAALLAGALGGLALVRRRRG